MGAMRQFTSPFGLVPQIAIARHTVPQIISGNVNGAFIIIMTVIMPPVVAGLLLWFGKPAQANGTSN